MPEGSNALPVKHSSHVTCKDRLTSWIFGTAVQ